MEQKSTAEHLIDIDEVLRSKLGRKAKWIPRFLVRWLKRIVHQDELNQFLRDEGDTVGVPWLCDSLRFLDVDIVVEGRENLPSAAEAQHCVFVSNHPLGGPDGVALGAVLGKHFEGKICYLVNDILLFLDGLAPLCVGINKTGRQSRSFPKKVDSAFHSDAAVIMFPAGLCSRRKNGLIRDTEWHKTFITKAIETNRQVVPIYFEGRNSDRFYRIASLCERLHLKVNVAMLFLVDEMFRNAHKTFHIRIGKPISPNVFDNSQSPREWAQAVKRVVYSMENK